MEWLLIYVFVMIERIGSMLMMGWLVFWIGIICLLVAISAAVLKADAWGSQITFSEAWKEYQFTLMLKSASKWLITIGFIVGTLGFLTPSQKDAAIIVGSGMTYNVLTSETGKRLGGKAVDLLEQKIDEALKNEPTPPKKAEKSM